MKIALCAETDSPNSRVQQHFGRSSCYIIADTDAATFKAIENPEKGRVRVLRAEGAEAVVAGAFGARSLRNLAASGIVPYVAHQGTVRENMAAYLSHKLRKAEEEESVQSHKCRHKHGSKRHRNRAIHQGEAVTSH